MQVDYVIRYIYVFHCHSSGKDRTVHSAYFGAVAVL